MRRQIRIGSAKDVFQYDDADFSSAIETDQPMKAGTPADPTDVLRLSDIGATVGDVFGPAASTDNAIVRFDGVTGKALQDSLVTISDAGSITLPAGQTVDGIDISAHAIDVDAHHNQLHNATHVTGGGDTIADVIAAGNSGLMSGVDKTKLDGIEALADVTDLANVNTALGGLAGIANNDLMRWNDPGSTWEAKDIAEVILSQNINPGNITMNDDAWIGIGAALERIIFDAAGDISFMGCRVGIGTMTPVCILSIESSVANGAKMRITETGDTTDAHYSGIDFRDGAAFKGGLFKDGASHNFNFWTASNIRLKITQVGNVNIVAHNAATVGLKLGGTLVTVSAVQINFLENVSHGVNDSGGVGFKLLRVPN